MFGFEESYGYLTGSYVRDKDGVDGAYMICEMFSYYATKGISLLDKLEELYKTYGYCLNTLHSYEFDGSAGFAKMQSIMQAFRGGIKEFGGRKVVKLLDYAPGLDGLPKSDVLKFLLEDNCSIVVRPSGTEPKLKTYISVSAENKEAAEKVEAEISKSAEAYLKYNRRYGAKPSAPTDSSTPASLKKGKPGCCCIGPVSRPSGARRNHPPSCPAGSRRARRPSPACGRCGASGAGWCWWP